MFTIQEKTYSVCYRPFSKIGLSADRPRISTQQNLQTLSEELLDIRSLKLNTVWWKPKLCNKPQLEESNCESSGFENLYSQIRRMKELFAP